MILALAYSIVYLLYILDINSALESVTLSNLYLFQTTLWTTELVSIFISLKTLLLKKTGKIDTDFMNFESENMITNEDYYSEMKKIANNLYSNLTYHYGKLEMEIPNYLNETQLISRRLMDKKKRKF